MNSKVWLTVYGLIAFLVVGGTGFYAFSSHGKYAAEMESWNTKVSSIVSLQRRVPYPDEDNAAALKTKVDEYKASVKALSDTLKSFNRELNKTLLNTEFQQLVSKKVEEFRAAAKEGNLEIGTETEFQLGFDSYATSVPAPELVPVLDYELEAIDHLLRKLIACGASSLLSFERDAIPGEPGGAEKHDSGVVHKYPVRLRFKGSHDTLKQFVNDLANDRQFFYIVRVLKVKNEMREGPVKLQDAAGGFTSFQNPSTKEVASPDKLKEWGQGTATDAEVEAKAKEAGFIKADQDARVLMGQEKLEVFVVVDITRFLGPEEVAAQEPQPEARKGRQ